LSFDHYSTGTYCPFFSKFIRTNTQTSNELSWGRLHLNF